MSDDEQVAASDKTEEMREWLCEQAIGESLAMLKEQETARQRHVSFASSLIGWGQPLALALITVSVAQPKLPHPLYPELNEAAWTGALFGFVLISVTVFGAFELFEAKAWGTSAVKPEELMLLANDSPSQYTRAQLLYSRATAYAEAVIQNTENLEHMGRVAERARRRYRRLIIVMFSPTGVVLLNHFIEFLIAHGL